MHKFSHLKILPRLSICWHQEVLATLGILQYSTFVFFSWRSILWHSGLGLIWTDCQGEVEISYAQIRPSGAPSHTLYSHKKDSINVKQIFSIYFHQLCPLGLVGLVVAMSVRLSVCLLFDVPFSCTRF